jgi:hypothetical protein
MALGIPEISKAVGLALVRRAPATREVRVADLPDSLEPVPDIPGTSSGAT